MKNWTVKQLETLKSVPGKQKEYFEGTNFIQGIPGRFGIRVGAKSKTFFIQYRNKDGKQQKNTLGRYPALSLKEARALAAKRIHDLTKGVDPQEVKKGYIQAPTMKDLWEAYQESLARRQDKKAPVTIKEETRQWKTEFEPIIGNMKVVDITPVILAEILDKKAKTAPVSANRLHALLQVLFKPALRKGWLTVHPLHYIDKPGGNERSRQRVLSDTEIKTLWGHLDALTYNQRDIFKLGLYTAQRPGEIKSMAWEDIDLDAATWTLGESTDIKTKNVHIVPLSKQAVELLRARKDAKSYTRKTAWYIESEWVFPTAHNQRTGQQARPMHTQSLKRAREKLIRLSGVTGWHSHDIRRTARTIMSKIKISENIAERLLNHAVGGMNQVYNQHRFIDEKRVAVQSLANEIDRIAGIKARKTTIIRFRKTA